MTRTDEYHRPHVRATGGWSRIRQSSRLLAFLAGLSLVLQLFVLAPADAGTALTQVFSFTGRYGSVATGGTLRSQSNSGNACSLNSTSTATLTGIPASATIKAAYLIWSGSGSSVDTSVTFQGSSRSADRTYAETFDPSGYNLRFFTGVDDVTSLVTTTRNGTYTFGGLTVDSSSTYCSVQAVLSTWTMFVVYEDASQPNRVINLYEGLEYARGSATTAAISGFFYPPTGGDAKFAAVVLEGDPDLSAALSGFSEQFTFNGTIMSDSYNPAANPYNSASNVLASSTTYGLDLDSWNVNSLVAPGATSATLRISSGADLVLVTAALLEVQSLVADLSVTKTVSNPTPAQSSTVTYTVNLANAGPDASTGVAVTDQLPAGLTYLSHTVTQGTYLSATGVWTVGTVNSGGSATMTITARVTAAGGTAIVNTAQVSTSPIPDPDSKPGNNLPAEDDQASASITVNRPPVANPNSYTTAEDTTLNVAASGVLGNDSDPNGDPITVTGYTQPANGTVTVNANGSLTYIPNPNFNGIDTFNYTIADGKGGTATTTVTITVTPTNDPPVAVNDSRTTNEDTPVTVTVLANDSDPDGDPLTVQSVTQPANGAAVINAGGTVTYIPSPNFNGSDSFTYTISDGKGGTATATVNITVNPVNDPPVALDDGYATTEDTPLTITAPGVMGNDSDPDADPLAVASYTQPTNGTVTLNPNGSFTYTPGLNYSGNDTFTYTVCDTGSPQLCDAALVTIGVTAVNDDPNAVDDSRSTAEDTAITIPVLANDVDPDGDPLTVTGVSDPANGSAVINPDGTVTYTPDPNFNGTDTFTYDISDGKGETDTATITITVNPVNDLPLAVDDSGSTPEDTPVIIAVLGNDSDPDGDSLTVQSHTNPTDGTVIVNGDNTITYTPDPNFVGIDSFDYTISDGNGGTDTATVTITVTPVQDPPVAVDNAYTTAEDTPLVVTAPGVLGNDTDPDGDTLTVTGTTNPPNGTVTVNPNGSLTYTPDPNYSGTDSFTYTISDGNGGTATATVTITVTPVNDAPTAVADAGSTPEDTPVTISVASNDTDPEGDSLIVTGTTSPANGSVVVNGDNTVTYTPNPNYSGTDSFTYTISDGNGGTATATVTITVTPVNDPPVANDDFDSTDEDLPVTIDVLHDDSDIDGTLVIGSVSIPTAPSNGMAVVNPDGTITYTPNSDFSGVDTFEYEVCDNDGDCDTATVTVTVNPINDPPQAQPDSTSTLEETPVIVDVLANDSDPDGDALTVVLVTDPAHGTATINPDGTVTYTPDPDYNGPDSFTYEVCDPSGACDSAVVTVVDVTPVNDPPVANDDFDSTDEDLPVTIDVVHDDSDIDGTLVIASVNVTVAPTNGTTTVNVDGTITYTPNPDFSGVDTFEYEVCDNDGACDTAAVTVTVNPINDPPEATNDNYSTPEDIPLVVPAAEVLTNDTDPDGDTLSVTLVTVPAHGTLVLNPNGSFTYTPASNYSGPDSFTYQVCDPTGACDTAVASVTVSPVNDAPVANDDAASTLQDIPVTVPAPGVLGNDSDVEGNALTVTGNTNPPNGAVTVNGDGSYTYIPNAGYSGPDSFTYTISDGNGGTDTATVFLTVNPLQPPSAVDDAYTTSEDTTLVVPAAGVLTNDTDPEGDPLTVGGYTQPAHGTVTVGPDGSFTYTPNPNYSGPDSFTYQVCDTSSLCDNAAVAITVTPVNDPPVANDDLATTNEDTPVTIPVLDDDSDFDGTLVIGSVNVTTAPTKGTTTVNGDGTITYTPDPGTNGVDTFEYQVCDNDGDCDTATVTVTVNPINDPPVANNDAATTNEDTPVTIPVLGNDTDPDGDTLTVVLANAPAHGTVVINGDNTVTYTPDPNYSGPDSFEYQICDPSGACDTGSVAITVTPVNDNPTAVDDAYTTPEDTPLVVGTPGVLGNDTDIDGDTLTVQSHTNPTNGTVTVNPDGSLTYTPNPNYTGTDTFDYTVSDGNGGTDTATVTITVSPVNDNPTAVNDNGSTPEDTPITISVLANDTDPDGDTLTVTTTTAPAHGTVTINGDNTITYTHDLNYTGTDSFTYTISDSNGGTDTARVTITVGGVNDDPVAVDDSGSTPEDTPITMTVLGNDSDTDGDTLTVTGTTAPANGTVTINGDNTITYTPNLNYNGTDSFTYTITDGNGGTDTATVTITITITALNDNPVATDDAYTTPEDTPLMVVAPGVLGNDTDPDGDSLTVTGNTAPTNGTVTVNPNGSLTYTPNPNYTGTDTFTYTISDGNGGTDAATVTITITPVNDAPVAINDAAATNPVTAIVIAVLGNDSDVDGDVLAVTSTSLPANGTVAINPDGTITYTPALGFDGVDSFTYVVSDGNGSSAVATVTVTVGAANHPPAFTGDPTNTSQTVVVGGTLTRLVAGDPDGDPYTFVLSAGALPPGITLNADGTFNGAPAATGTFSATVTVCDIYGLCSTSVLVVQVVAPGELPRTGVDSGTMGILALLLMLLGGMLVTGSRRRREQLR